MGEAAGLTSSGTQMPSTQTTAELTALAGDREPEAVADEEDVTGKIPHRIPSLVHRNWGVGVMVKGKAKRLLQIARRVQMTEKFASSAPPRLSIFLSHPATIALVTSAR